MIGQDKRDKDHDKSNQGEDWEHITILIPPLFTEMVATSEEIEGP